MLTDILCRFGLCAGGIGTTSTASDTLTYGCKGQIHVESSRVERNTAVNDGGGVYVAASNLTLMNATVANNTAGEDGGGVSVQTRSQVQVEMTCIEGNWATAGVGGGFSVGEDCTLALVGSTVAFNSAGMHGGQKPLVHTRFIFFFLSLCMDLTFLPTMFRGDCRREAHSCSRFGKDPQGSNPRGQLADGA